MAEARRARGVDLAEFGKALGQALGTGIFTAEIIDLYERALMTPSGSVLVAAVRLAGDKAERILAQLA